MKLALLLCVVSSYTFAQQKSKPVKNIDRIDSLDLDFDWKKEVFKMWDCYCPWLKVDSVQAMPRENSPYKWDKSKPLVIYLDSASLKYFKGQPFFIDSTKLKKKKPVSL